MIKIILLPKHECDAVIQLLESYLNQIQELQEQLVYLQAENYKLRMINWELQCRVDPYSSDGDAVCNSRF